MKIKGAPQGQKGQSKNSYILTQDVYEKIMKKVGIEIFQWNPSDGKFNRNDVELYLKGGESGQFVVIPNEIGTAQPYMLEMHRIKLNLKSGKTRFLTEPCLRFVENEAYENHECPFCDLALTSKVVDKSSPIIFLPVLDLRGKRIWDKEKKVEYFNGEPIVGFLTLTSTQFSVINKLMSKTNLVWKVLELEKTSEGTLMADIVMEEVEEGKFSYKIWEDRDIEIPDWKKIFPVARPKEQYEQLLEYIS